jgi:hypothetical protein
VESVRADALSGDDADARTGTTFYSQLFERLDCFLAFVYQEFFVIVVVLEIFEAGGRPVYHTHAGQTLAERSAQCHGLAILEDQTAR